MTTAKQPSEVATPTLDTNYGWFDYINGTTRLPSIPPMVTKPKSDA